MVLDAWQSLERQSRRLEVAYTIIQAVHSELSLERVLDGIVASLVEEAGFAGAEIAIDATIEGLVVRHACSAGTPTDQPDLRRDTAVYIRGIEIGTITAHFHSGDVIDEQSEVLEFVLPTLFMVIDHAVSFAEVLDYRKTLEAKVVERTAQLADALDDLREAKASRDRFFSNINHEIRTPLTLIQLAADDIARTGELSSADATRKLDEIHAATRRLLHLVNSLLQLAAGDEGKVVLRPAATDVAACLQRLVGNWTSAAERGQLALAYDGPATCAAVLDESALETIAGNLISNAVKFTPPGGQVTVSLRATDTEVTVGVRDTGTGVDPDFLPKLFTRFERATSATRNRIRGSGIGLALAKELVDLQRGSIRLSANQPTGAAFEVTLPRHQEATGIAHERVTEVIVGPPAPMREAAAPPGEHGALAEATILLAEDDEPLARRIEKILSAKYRVLVAHDGRRALELAREHLPDLLVTDLEMPHMDGLELTRAFLDLAGRALAPVLIVSAHTGIAERLAGFEAGAVDYITKPFSADELLARVRSQLAMRRLAAKLHESEKLAAIGMLSAGLAHELRNPANAVVNALDPLWRLLPAAEREPNSTGSVIHEVMSAAATKLRDLCANVLELSRTGHIVRRPVPFEAMFRRVWLVSQPLLAEVDLIQDIALQGPIHCAGPLVEQILINLLDNAAYAAGRGGKVFVAARHEHDLAVIEISDSGPGVPVHLQERIFDPFFTTKPVGEGTGLGLSVSRRIALDHGGDLRVVRRGERSAFRLELPQP